MRITISVPGAFQPAFLWARYLEAEHRLDRIITPLPYGRTRRFGVARSRTRALWPLGGWNHTVQRFGPGLAQGPNQLFFSALFDLAASRLLGNADVFNGWASAALHGIRAARRRGLPAVLQTGSAHIVAQDRLLREESAKFGVAPPSTHPGVIARTLREYEEADAIVVPSRFVYRTFVEAGVPASKLSIVAETALPRTTHTSRDGLRALRQTPRILFVGQIGVRKGIPYLLQAFGRLRTPATLRLVGPADRRLMARLGPLPPGVELAGPKAGADLAAEYASADVFVLPSVEDGFGLVTVEAMAAGLPVVVSGHAGSADIVDDGVDGFVVPARDADALLDRLDVLVADARLRQRMGAAARAKAERRTWKEYGASLDREVYARLGFGSAARAEEYARAT